MLAICPDMIERIELADEDEDVFGGCAPDEGLRLGSLQQVVVDLGLELINDGVAAPAGALCGYLGKEGFDQIHPGRAGWREMQLAARMLVQQRPHLRRFVGGVVVKNRMNVARFFQHPVNAAQKAQEPFGAVTRHAFPNDKSRLDLQRGEKRGGAMALVIMGRGGRAHLLQRQHWPGTIERLDPRLIVHAEHNGSIRWAEVMADDLGDLTLEHRVVRDCEPFHDMRLETRAASDAPNARGRYAHRRRYHHRAAPMRGIRRRLLHSLRDHLQPDLPIKRRNTRGPRLVALELLHAFIEIPFQSAPNRQFQYACSLHDFSRTHAICCCKHNTCPPVEFTRRVAVVQQSLKIGAVGGAKIRADVGASHPAFMKGLSRSGNPMSGV